MNFHQIDEKSDSINAWGYISDNYSEMTQLLQIRPSNETMERKSKNKKSNSVLNRVNPDCKPTNKNEKNKTKKTLAYKTRRNYQVRFNRKTKTSRDSHKH